MEEAARDAFYRVIKDWGISGSADMAVHLETLCQLAGMVRFGCKNNLSVEQPALGCGFALLEGAVAAAIKLVPIGHKRVDIASKIIRATA